MNDNRTDLVLKAMAHPERRRIFASLHRKPEQSLFEICTTSHATNGQALSRQTISQHLNALEKAGLIESSWKGRTKMHSAKASPLKEAYEDVLKPYLQERNAMQIHITSIFVDDQSNALEFYTNKLGFKPKNDIPVGEHRWLTVVSAEQPEGTELLLEPSDHPAVPPFKNALMADGIPAASFRVENLDAEFERLTKQGVKFTQAPIDAGDVSMAVLDDTCGNLVQLVQLHRQT